MDPDTPAIRAVVASGVPHRVVVFGPVTSLEEAASAQGLTPAQVCKSMVVRLDDGTYRLVIVPGDRRISWPKFRSFVGVNRTSMPDAEEALAVTGYRRGTITPFGATGISGVIVDAATGEHELITVGGGDHGVSIHLSPDDLVSATGGTGADVTDPA